ncbi:CCA tRNA nucleotidyltransferase [Corynebacterium pelargi]|uniref:CCA-adding enzyme n=1 Tax=Corynebacterium pelargi TaxID=1471400 RepID=A0A410WBV8_9CORY|nr:CCA tRNA nucleotidyltransferase [Corynebacterium pelargi]QAU53448.1 CCA-adding enzyme [Corynebacterium pelargi]
MMTSRNATLLLQGQKEIAKLQPVLRPLAQAFRDRGYSLYLVGGSVRDALLGRLGHDLDFTTEARPEQVQEILQALSPSVWDTGIDFGTISAEMQGMQIEITTFRADSYDGQSRNPEVQYGDRLEDDLIRRDFRVNAMALELDVEAEPVFHDPLGGLEDLERRVIDTPAAPELSFHDDPLRMLRAARFVSQLEFSLAPRVHKAMEEMAGQIERISAERVQMELDKLMLGQAPWDGIRVMVDTGLADVVYPEISALRLTQDEHRQHKDVYEHSLTVLRQAVELEENPDLVLRWAALTHDIGKPATREFHENGRVSFHQHEVVGAKMVRKRMRKLKYSKQMVKDVSQLVFLHMRFHGFSEDSWTDSAVRRYVNDAGDQLEQLNTLVRADVTTRNRKKAQRLRRLFDLFAERIEDLAAKEDLAKVRPALDGNAIMELLGLQPGPEVGQAWQYLKELRLERGPMETEEAEAALQAWWKERQEA